MMAELTDTNYGRWRKVRRYILAKEPICRLCMVSNPRSPNAATQVDHIVPRSKGGPLFDPSNLQPLCDECHYEKTSREFAGPVRTGACVHGTPNDKECKECRPNDARN